MKVSYVHLIGSLRSSCRIPEYDGNNFETQESSVPLPILESHSSNSPLCLLSSKEILSANLGKPNPLVLTRSSKVAARPPCLQLDSLIKRSKDTVLKIQYTVVDLLHLLDFEISRSRSKKSSHLSTTFSTVSNVL